jgi:uncharacterized NAD(P)/FAD-binding protein YdhS
VSARHVAVIGGGYSGTVQAIELVRRGATVTLVERSGRPGRGVAYGTGQPDHLLNVRAARMAAFAGDGNGFADWLAKRGGGGPDSFAERRLYGTYLEEQLAEAQGVADGRLRIVQGSVIGIEGGSVRLEDGTEIGADAIVLALGNLPPTIPLGLDGRALPRGVYVADPWRTDLARDLEMADGVLLIGTGLTAIDAALSLDSAGFRGRILALSRRGLVPRSHGPPAAPPPLQEPASPDCLSLLRTIRADADGDWRAAIDQFRPVTQQLWREAGVDQRRRFLRHLRPWWDVHRHRIAPSIAARIEAMRGEARLDVAAGKIVSVSPHGEGADLRWRPRGRTEEQSILVRRIVNCTGPSGDIAAGGEPLLASLIEAGRIRPDPCRLGIDVDRECRAIDRAGRPSPDLYAIGPLTKGAFWESVAVPDLREQIRALALGLTAR